MLQCKFPCKGVAAIANKVGTCAGMVTLLRHFHFVVDGNVLPVPGVFL